MSSTGTTLLGWVAHVARCAKIVRTSGGAADEGAELAVLLEGLLPEFNPIKLLLNQRPNLTLRDATSILMDFARNENLLELRKGGSQHKAKDNVFSVSTNKTRAPYTQEQLNQMKTELCKAWALGYCRYKDKCYRKHEGAFGHSKTNKARPALDKPAPTPVTTDRVDSSAACHLCHQRPQHELSECPVAKSTNIDFTFLVAPAKDKRHVEAADHPDEVTWSEAIKKVLSERKDVAKVSAYTVDGSQSTDATLSCSAIVFAIFGLMLSLLTLPLASTKHFFKDFGQVQSLRFAVLILVLVFMLPAFVTSNDTEGSNYARSYIIGQDDTSNCGGVEWCADTGTNRFVTNNIADFLPDSITDVNITVGVGNGSYVVKKQGSIVVENHLGKTILCKNALYMPSCGKKLMPATPFIRAGCSLNITNQSIQLRSPGGEVLLEGKEVDQLYYFNAKTVLPMDFLNRPTKSAPNSTYFGLPFGHAITTATADFAHKLLETHQAYGHLNFSKLRKLFGLKVSDDPHCPACAIAKSRKAPLNKMADRSTRINHRLHVDIGYTAGSQNPFQLYVDDFIRVSHLDLLNKKEDVLQFYIDLKTLLENQHAPWKFAYVRSDNEFVYTSNAWIQFCRDAGIEHEFSPPYRHDAMGVVERAMQVIGVAFRCMMLQGNAPASMIPYALMHANVIRNHSPSKANSGRTPLEKEAGVKLPINKRLIKGVLFCLVYIHVYEEQRVKHGDRSVPCVYLGFDSTNNQFIGMEWLTGKIHFCGDGSFMPSIFPFRSNPHKVPSWMNECDHLTPSRAVSAPALANHSLPTGPRRSYRPHSDQFHGGQIDIPVAPQEGESGIRRSQRQHDYQHSVDVDGNAVPVVDIPDVVSLAVGEPFSPELYYVNNWGPDPANWDEALSGPHASQWVIAMLEERESFRQREVYVLVPRSQADGHRIFKSRPVLKIKYNPPTPEEPNGSLDKFKYRLTIAAFTSMLKEGIDYKEKFASTVRWSALKLIISQAVLENWDLLHIDIKTFFLYGVLDEG